MRTAYRQTGCGPHLVDHTVGSRLWFPVRRILYKGILVRNIRCSRHQQIDEADISTSVAIDPRAANCLEESCTVFYRQRTRSQSSRANPTFRRPLPVFGVVRFSSVHCLQIRSTVELFRSTRAAIERQENPPY
ncbi:uncharacterized protein TNCV_3884331 [Trichonephila clavipes]|nr:uncharacterized protein TNCV_3884331 [Trichonephila clavipes]